MRTLDRYIIRSYVTTALLFFVIMISLRVVIDMFFKMDEFAEKAESFSEALTWVLVYYSCQVFLYFTELGSVIVFMAAVFTLARMNHTNELTAMLASGVSLHRVVWPIIVSAMLMAGLIVIDQEFIIPRIKEKLVVDPDDVLRTEAFAIDLMADSSGTVWYSKYFHPDKGIMDRPVVILRDEKLRGVARVSGDSATPTVRDGRQGWLVSNATFSWVGRERNVPSTQKVFTGTGPGEFLREAFKGRRPGSVNRSRLRGLRNPMARDAWQGLTIHAERLVLAPVPPGGSEPGGRLERPTFTFASEDGRTLAAFVAASAEWTVGQGEDRGWELTGGMLFCPSDLTAEDVAIRQSSRWVSYLSTGELTDLLRLDRVPDQDAALMARHLRITEPLNALIVLMLGLPFILSRERDLKASAGLCLLVIGLFFASVHGLRHVGLPPAAAAWLPVLVFGPGGVVMFDSIKT